MRQAVRMAQAALPTTLPDIPPLCLSRSGIPAFRRAAKRMWLDKEIPYLLPCHNVVLRGKCSQNQESGQENTSGSVSASQLTENHGWQVRVLLHFTSDIRHSAIRVVKEFTRSTNGRISLG